ncbi:MAG: Gfo/Idh/MocA family oxidoreductase [Kiritimatiellae bacterium]|nr:Gfo/Idh/MocA family oxidoreductase [Kiritimatiellia bacterium]
MSARNIAAAGILLLEAAFAGCVSEGGPRSVATTGSPKWKPIGNRRARVVHWGVIHNHSRGKWDAVRLLKDDYELVGWVDDRASTAMRMSEPKIDVYTNYPCFTPQRVFDEVKPDLIVVETANSDLVEVSTEIARHGIPMHMDKPLGTDQEGYRRMSAICEARGVPLQIGYMFRSNEAINKMVELAKGGVLGEIYSIEADLDHSYGYPKYPVYASHYPGGTAYLLACHAIEWAMPIFDDDIPLRTYSIIKPAPGDPEWAKTHSLTIMEYPRANVVIRVCSRGTQPCRHIRIDGTDGSMELEPVEDFRTVKHTTGLNEDGLSRVDKLEIRMFLKKANDKARALGFREGINRLSFKAPQDRYAGQLRELARILRGEIPNPPGLYLHDLKVHKVSLDACNLKTEDVK